MTYPHRPPTYSVRDKRAPKTAPRPLEATELVCSTIFQEAMRDLPHEEMWLLMVDAMTHITGMVKVGQGGTSGIAILPRDILRPVIAHNASGFIIAHNHPSGDPTPSRDDIEFTLALVKGAQAVGVPLLDHFVIARDSYKSFFALGLIA